ncbi:MULTISPECIES: DUF3592 domain-containing protein [Streptomyces]|uniref:DUF3592 domain-containing protein n=1 Tax=Streptomyces TaxID=1883 RepID=UPI000CD4922E|nr:DUF3592 domain-containing protein [Streptomyces sp. ZL-24]POG48780.1 hypothetical protein BV881_04400 [Streptomyces sp. ZL-24]
MRKPFEYQDLIPLTIGTAVTLLASFVFFSFAANILILRFRGVLGMAECVAQRPYSSVVRYQGPDGVFYERAVGAKPKSSIIPSFGDQVEILYDPKKPGRCSRTPLVMGKGVFFALMGGISLAAAVSVAASPFTG